MKVPHCPKIICLKTEPATVEADAKVYMQYCMFCTVLYCTVLYVRLLGQKYVNKSKLGIQP